LEAGRVDCTGRQMLLRVLFSSLEAEKVSPQRVRVDKGKRLQLESVIKTG
jgi:hypothetical protein